MILSTVIGIAVLVVAVYLLFKVCAALLVFISSIIVPALVLVALGFAAKKLVDKKLAINVVTRNQTQVRHEPWGEG